MAQAVPSDLLISLPDGFHLYGFLSTGLAAQLAQGNPGHCTFLVPPEALGEMPADLRSAARWQEFPHHRLSLLEETINFVRRTASRHLIPSMGATRSIVEQRSKLLGGPAGSGSSCLRAVCWRPIQALIEGSRA